MNDLQNPIVGEQIQIIPPNENIGNIIGTSKAHALPDAKKINDIVHILTTEEIRISPKSFVVTKETTNISLAKKMLRLSSLSLAASIVSEFHSDDKIILDGVRTVSIKLYDSKDSFSLALNNNLLELVEWVYSDKVATRLKLFLERLTLEMDESRSLIHELNIYLEPVLAQAEQRYNFVILERKDKYLAELKDLLKDIRTQSDLYSQKIRNLLNNLLRDILAAVVLIGFTIFTKFSDNIQLDKERLLSFVFTGLAIYYLLSIVLQTVVDIVDVQVSKREMLYWKTPLKNCYPKRILNSILINHYKEEGGV